MLSQCVVQSTDFLDKAYIHHIHRLCLTIRLLAQPVGTASCAVFFKSWLDAICWAKPIYTGFQSAARSLAIHTECAALQQQRTLACPGRGRSMNRPASAILARCRQWLIRRSGRKPRISTTFDHNGVSKLEPFFTHANVNRLEKIRAIPETRVKHREEFVRHLRHVGLLSQNSETPVFLDWAHDQNVANLPNVVPKLLEPSNHATASYLSLAVAAPRSVAPFTASPWLGVSALTESFACDVTASNRASYSLQFVPSNRSQTLK